MKKIILILLISLSAYSNSIETKALNEIRPTDGYKYFSGYDSKYNNLPTMYTYGYKNSKIVVVGKGFIKEFSINEFSKAVQAYKALLILNGYEPTN